MITKTFIKTLSANDLGTTGSHMGGIHVPKGDGELLAFLPSLDAGQLNPSTWINCETQDGQILKLRFIYYNNKYHTPQGTRNEYRITWLTKFLRSANAKEGDGFEISRTEEQDRYRIRVIPIEREALAENGTEPVRIRLTTEWRRVN